MDPFEFLSAAAQHPFMAAVHPWLLGSAWALAVVGLLILAWGVFVDEDRLWWGGILACFLSGMVAIAAHSLNPAVDDDARFAGWCLLATVLLLIGWRWESAAEWEIRPFRFVWWVPSALAMGRVAMSIPAHVISGAEKVVVFLNQVPEPVKNALIIGAVILTFVSACVKLIKNVVT